MKPKRHHFKFERRFVEDVRAFRKHCTIRAKRKRLARPGDVAVFSHWTEAAYRSPSVPIGETILTNVTPINTEATPDDSWLKLFECVFAEGARYAMQTLENRGLLRENDQVEARRQ